MPPRLRVFISSPGILGQLRRALALIFIAPLLAGCGSPIDGEQLRLCREVIPALNPDRT